MPHHHAQHTQNVGPNLFVHNENSAYVMPRVAARAVTSCAHCTAHAPRQASTYGHAICASQTIFKKISHLTL